MTIIFDSCFKLGQLKEAVGIAISSKRLDVCKRALSLVSGNEKASLLSYMFDAILASSSSDLPEKKEVPIQLIITIYSPTLDVAASR